MARNAKFNVVARFDAGGRFSEGTVTVERDTNVVRIRAKRRRHETLTTLDALAQIAIWKEAKELVAEKKKARRVKRGGR